MAKPTSYLSILDKLGMTASGVCGIHCLMMPLVFVLFPYASIAFLKGEMFEIGFLIFSLIIASFAMVQGFLVHRKIIPLVLASTGFAVFIGVRVALHDSHETFSGSLVFFFAGALICLAHYLNHKLIKTKNCACAH